MGTTCIIVMSVAMSGTKKKTASKRFVPLGVLRDPRLSNTEFRVLLALYAFDPCFPSYTELMLITGMGRSTIARILKDLKEKQVITWVKGHQGKNNRYTINSVSRWWIDR